jgi:hypothetical protein
MLNPTLRNDLVRAFILILETTRYVVQRRARNSEDIPSEGDDKRTVLDERDRNV